MNVNQASRAASRLTRRSFATVAALSIAGALSACSNSDPLAKSGETVQSSGASSAGGDASAVLTIGSQAYYSNEIIAELFAQVLEHEGYPVQRQYQIGQREIYVKELEAGKIDVFPEYSGALLQYYNPKAATSSAQEVFQGLKTALPNNLRALPFAEATDQDSYACTAEFSAAHGLTSLDQLKQAADHVTLVANSEIAARPYGPKGLKSVYGVDATLVPVEDSGGPLTVKALKDGTAQIADIYSASPAIASEHLVVLADPKNLFVSQNVTPIVTKKVDDKAASAIASVTSQLTTEDLVALNTQSVTNGSSSAEIAKAWLTKKGLLN